MELSVGPKTIPDMIACPGIAGNGIEHCQFEGMSEVCAVPGTPDDTIEAVPLFGPWDIGVISRFDMQAPDIVDELELSVRAHNCLKAANIRTLAELVQLQEQELLKFRNFGRKSLAELVEIVENYGLEFGMDVDHYINDNSENN